MRIVDRYVIRQILVPFILGLLVFTFIFIIPEVMKYAESFIAKGVSPVIVVQAMARLVPYALGLTIPMSLLLGLLVAFGRLSADREFVAMQACGISLMRLLRPVGLVSVLCWATTSYIYLYAIPENNQAFRDIAFNVAAARAEGEVKPRVFYDDFPNLVLYVREISAAGDGWEGVFMADSRPGQAPATYLARRGRVVVDRQRQRVDVVLDDGSQHTSGAPEEYRVTTFERQVLSVNPSSMFPSGDNPKGDNEMTIAELRERIAEQEARGDSTHNQYMAIHRKFAFPVACLVFGLIGLALGATNRRDGMLGSFVFALAVVFAYYVPLILGPSLAKGGWVPPWLAVWLSNIVLGALGVVLFVWRDRIADQPIRLPVPAIVARVSRRDRDGTRLPLLSVLDWYVAQKYARILLLTAGGLAGIFYISTFLDLSDKLFKGETTGRMLVSYFWFATPQFVYYIIPLSVLIAALVTIAVLTKNSELVVMKACGISLYRIAVPIMVIALLAGGTLFALEQTILGPWNRRAEAIRHVIRGGSPETFDVLNRRWVVGTGGEIYHYNYFDPRQHRFSGLTIYEFTDGMERLTRHTYAEHAVSLGESSPAVAPVVAAALDEGASGLWRLRGGWSREFADDRQPGAFAAFDETTRRFETAEHFSTDHPEPAFMSYSQLRRYTGQLEASGFDVAEQEVALARKVSFPFVTIVMTLLAVPFAVTIGRSGAMAGIAVGIVLAITYWTANSVFAAMGTGGLIAPVLAAWAPNLLFGAGAVYMLLTVRT
jgi:LPS export ABC transporter permease LptF/LPS export ABC transporter permease LptG